VGIAYEMAIAFHSMVGDAHTTWLRHQTSMRTTLAIGGQLLADLKRLAQTTGKPFRQVVEVALRAGLSALEHPSPLPYRLQPRSLGPPQVGADLVKALALSDAPEDESLREKQA
jgi:hypothetical protein